MIGLLGIGVKIVVGIAAIVAITAGAIFLMNRPSSVAQNKNFTQEDSRSLKAKKIRPSSVPRDSDGLVAPEWKTYTNKKYGYTVDWPDNIYELYTRKSIGQPIVNPGEDDYDWVFIDTKEIFTAKKEAFSPQKSGQAGVGVTESVGIGILANARMVTDVDKEIETYTRISKDFSKKTGRQTTTKVIQVGDKKALEVTISEIEKRGNINRNIIQRYFFRPGKACQLPNPACGAQIIITLAMFEKDGAFYRWVFERDKETKETQPLNAPLSEEEVNIAKAMFDSFKWK